MPGCAFLRTRCDDPQCGDSTWDHYCKLPYVCTCESARKHAASLAAAKEAVVEASREIIRARESGDPKRWTRAIDKHDEDTRTLLALEAGRDAGDKEETK